MTVRETPVTNVYSIIIQQVVIKCNWVISFCLLTDRSRHLLSFCNFLAFVTRYLINNFIKRINIYTPYQNEQFSYAVHKA